MSTLRRFARAGFTFISATLEDFPPTMEGVCGGIDKFREAAAAESSWLAIARNRGEIVSGESARKLTLGFNVQDTIQLGTDLSNIARLHSAGVLHMQLAYNTRNFVADGCAESSDAGLSQFGRHVVKEMNRLGMIVDCSHVGHRSSLEAIEQSSLPVIFSHSGAYRVCAHIRNIRDDQIRACAARQGVIGIVGIGGFLGDVSARAESVFRHLDYVASLVGTEYVGLGTDYVQDMESVWDAIRAQRDWGWPDPTGTQLTAGRCFEPEQLPELVGLMQSHGYPERAIKAILGENFLRVYQAVA